jgi:hypothetical protein
VRLTGKPLQFADAQNLASEIGQLKNQVGSLIDLLMARQIVSLLPAQTAKLLYWPSS